MARHGRRFPIKPHLAQPIVGAPVVSFIAPPAKIVSLAGLGQKRPVIRPHLASPIVGPAASNPPIVSKAYVVNLKTRPDRRIFRANVAKGIVGAQSALPLVTRAYILKTRDRIPRKGNVWLPKPITGAPQQPPLWAQAFIFKPVSRMRKSFRVEFAGPIVGPFVPIPISGGGKAISGQATCSGAISGQASSPGAISGQSLL